jgi:hypothetical protein
MKKLSLSPKFVFVTAAILLAAFSRIFPHPANFSPLGAIALFGAAHFNDKKFSFLIPLFATWLSDLFINNVIYGQYYSQFTWLNDGFYWIYGSYMLITFVGIFLFKNKVDLPRILAGSVIATTIFFLLTNLACWPASNNYTQDLSGLMSCYAAGVPFLQGTFFGDLFYCGLLFGTYHYAKARIPALA